jgi:hypothetical protein
MSLFDKITSCSNRYTKKLDTIKDPKGASKSVYKIDNKEEIIYNMIEFDGCVFKNLIKKCDYGLDVNNTIHFIELKGSDINSSLKQIYTTIVETKEIFKSHTKKVRIIVSSIKAPQNLDRITQRKISLLIGKTSSDKSNYFIIAKNSFTEIIS